MKVIKVTKVTCFCNVKCIAENLCFIVLEPELRNICTENESIPMYGVCNGTEIHRIV